MPFPGNVPPPTSQKGQKTILRLLNHTGSSLYGQETLVEFMINPEELSLQSPTRQTTTQTIGGAYQDIWGPGVGRFQLSGTTGWKRRDPNGDDGFQHFIRLRALHKAYQNLVAENDPSLVKLEVLLPPGFASNIFSQTGETGLAGNLGSGLTQAIGAIEKIISTLDGVRQFGYYRISSDNLVAQRSRSQPLLFRYQWDFTIVKDLLQTYTVDPSKRFVYTASQSGSDPLAGGGGGTSNGGGDSGSGSGNGQPGFSDFSLTMPPFTWQQEDASAATTTWEKTLQGGDMGIATTVLAPQSVTLSQISQSFGVNEQELRVFNFALNGTVLSTGHQPANQQIAIPTTQWLSVFRQRLEALPGSAARPVFSA